MSQLILGAAYNYSTELLKPFIYSLRRYYQDNCVLITHPLSEEELDFYSKHNIFTCEVEEVFSNPKDIQVDRYEIYKSVLEDNFAEVDQVLISDIRDVMFQDDPFKLFNGSKQEFFMEPCLFKNCTANAPWIRSVYNNPGLDLVKDEYIICSGTTMGTRVGILEYIDTMITEINRIRATGRPLYPGEDQPIHNYLIYSGMFKEHKKSHNGIGSVTTMHHQHQLLLDRKGRLLNADGSLTPIIHQWDRAGACKSILENQALNG